MRRTVAILLVLLMVLPLCGFSKSDKEYVFGKSKEAYDSINEAYIGTEFISGRLYEAWHQCVNNNEFRKLTEIKDYKKDPDSAMKYLAEKVEIKYDYMLAGGKAALYAVLGVDPDNIPANVEKSVNSIIAGYEQSPDIGFALIGQINSSMKKNISLADYVVSMTIYAIKEAGLIDEIQELLDDSKAVMKELSKDYSDYEHYPNLKGLYTTTSSFFDFCQHPTGSFEQCVSTMNDYKNKARDYKASLDFIFED